MAIAATASLLYRTIYATVAYLIPGYQSFKAIERKNVTEVMDWGRFWVVLSALYCLQWMLDFVLCWLPFYYVAKLGFLVALWHPSTRWALSLYDKLLVPVVGSYEADIDKFVVESRTKFYDVIGHHATAIKHQARELSGRATVAIKNVQAQAVERAKAASRKSGAGADATAGLHAE